jgi:hypothetical protein
MPPAGKSTGTNLSPSRPSRRTAHDGNVISRQCDRPRPVLRRDAAPGWGTSRAAASGRLPAVPLTIGPTALTVSRRVDGGRSHCCRPPAVVFVLPAHGQPGWRGQIRGPGITSVIIIIIASPGRGWNASTSGGWTRQAAAEEEGHTQGGPSLLLYNQELQVVVN